MARNTVSCQALFNGRKKASRLDVRDQKVYEDGKATDTYKSTILEIAVQGAGICQLVLPYRKGLSEEIEETLEYGSLFAPEDYFSIEDITISLYNNALVVKYNATEQS